METSETKPHKSGPLSHCSSLIFVTEKQDKNRKRTQRGGKKEGRKQARMEGKIKTNTVLLILKYSVKFQPDTIPKNKIIISQIG